MTASQEPTRSSAATSSSESRESPREALVTAVRVELSDTHVSGTTRNVSDNGLLLVTDEDLEVSIEYLDGEQPVSRRGRIVRVQGLSGNGLGIAIAFDADA